VFFKDKAEEDPPEYKIGDEQFWIESGDDWLLQLEKADRTPAKITSEEWKQRALRKLKKEKDNEEIFGKAEDWRMRTNQIGLASKEVRAIHEAEMKKKYAGGNTFAENMKKLDDGKLYKYIPVKTHNRTYRSDKYDTGSGSGTGANPYPSRAPRGSVHRQERAEPEVALRRGRRRRRG
jgi:hypothetical protein